MIPQKMEPNCTKITSCVQMCNRDTGAETGPKKEELERPLLTVTEQQGFVSIL